MSYFLALFLVCTSELVALDFGTFGTTYPIDEEDLIVVLQERLKKVKIDDQWYLDMEKALVNSVEKPKGRVMPKATALRIFEFDPTLVVNQEIRGVEGELIVAKGIKINPLETYALKNDLLFIDADDPKQISWARQHDGLWILTNGNPLSVEKLENKPVYFDQAGYMTKKLGILSLPAIVTQNDKKLKIEETPCN